MHQLKIKIPDQLAEADLHHRMDDEMLSIIEAKCGRFLRHQIARQLAADVEHGTLATGHDVYTFFKIVANTSQKREQNSAPNMPHIGEASVELRDIKASNFDKENIYFSAAFALYDGPISFAKFVQIHNENVAFLETNVGDDK